MKVDKKRLERLCRKPLCWNKVHNHKQYRYIKICYLWRDDKNNTNASYTMMNVEPKEKNIYDGYHIHHIKMHIANRKKIVM
jgi:hypothetical protein